jgi:3-dehydroquinate dehydratase/shikimate dehydrogenase
MSKPLLCVTVTAATTAELRHHRDAVADADLIELRLDTVRDPDVAGALQGRRHPVVVTCRPTWEGGEFKGGEEERKRILAEALSLGAEYVDLEWRARFDDLIARDAGRRIVLSSHDYLGVPIDLTARVHAMRSTGAEVIKIAAQANRLTDCLALLDVETSTGHRDRSILLAMGEAGLITRVFAGRFGSAWTYAGNLRALNQVSAELMLDDYRFRSIGPETALYGLAGSPIEHSVSPAMHNAAFVATGCDAVYLPFPAADAEDFATFARAVGVKGASVTIPFKVSLLDHVDEAESAIAHVERLGFELLRFLQHDRHRIPLRSSDDRVSTLGDEEGKRPADR